jgi:hypothetical protein
MQLWKNSLEFWNQLQLYHKIFYADVLNPYLLRNKAKVRHILTCQFIINLLLYMYYY